MLELSGFADHHDLIALLQSHRRIRIAAADAVATHALDPGRQPIRTELKSRLPAAKAPPSATAASGSASIASNYRLDDADNPGATEAAVSVRVLGEVLLVIVLSGEELGRWTDLGGDGAELRGI